MRNKDKFALDLIASVLKRTDVFTTSDGRNKALYVSIEDKKPMTISIFEKEKQKFNLSKIIKSKSRLQSAHYVLSECGIAQSTKTACDFLSRIYINQRGFKKIESSLNGKIALVIGSGENWNMISPFAKSLNKNINRYSFVNVIGCISIDNNRYCLCIPLNADCIFMKESDLQLVSDKWMLSKIN